MSTCEVIGYVSGYFVTVVIGHWLVHPIVHSLWGEAGWKQRPESEKRLSGALGFVERTTYLSALALDHANFVALWLGVKTAGTWVIWQSGLKASEVSGLQKNVSGRYVFNIFLVGNGLNLLFAGLGHRIIDLVPTNWPSALTFAAAGIISAVVLLIYCKGS